MALCGEGRFVHHLGYRRIRVDVGVDLRACEFLFERDAHLGDELGGIFADDVCAHCAKSNGSGMQTISGIMSQKSKTEYLESCGMRYPNRNRAGRSAMIDEVSDVLGWDRKHAIKALNGKVSLGKKARRRGSKAIHSEAEKAVIVGIWKSSEQPCGTRLNANPAAMAPYKPPSIRKSSATARAPWIASPPLTEARVAVDLDAKPGVPATGSINSCRSATARKPSTNPVGSKPIPSRTDAEMRGFDCDNGSY